MSVSFFRERVGSGCLVRSFSNQSFHCVHKVSKGAMTWRMCLITCSPNEDCIVRLKNTWAAPCEYVSSSTCGQRRPRSVCAPAQSDQGLRCPSPKSLDTSERINVANIRALRMRGSKSVHFVHVRRHIFAWRGPPLNYFFLYFLLPQSVQKKKKTSDLSRRWLHI